MPWPSGLEGWLPPKPNQAGRARAEVVPATAVKRMAERMVFVLVVCKEAMERL